MKGSRGFTFIELMVSVFIIAIASVVSLEFFNYCYKNFIVPDKLKLEAINYARGSMDAIYMKAYRSSDLDNTQGFVIDSAADWKLDGRSAKKSHSVATINSGGTQEYKVISTKVEWTR